MGSHLLPTEHDRFLHLRRRGHVCRLCHTEALDNKQHTLLSVLLLHILGRNYLRPSQPAQASWLCLCVPCHGQQESQHTLLDCHSDEDRRYSIHSACWLPGISE